MRFSRLLLRMEVWFFGSDSSHLRASIEHIMQYSPANYEHTLILHISIHMHVLFSHKNSTTHLQSLSDGLKKYQHNSFIIFPWEYCLFFPLAASKVVANKVVLPASQPASSACQYK